MEFFRHSPYRVLKLNNHLSKPWKIRITIRKEGGRKGEEGREEGERGREREREGEEGREEGERGRECERGREGGK